MGRHAGAALLALFLLGAPPAAAQALEAPYGLNEMLTDLGSGSLQATGPVAHLADLDRPPTHADRERWAEATVLTEFGPQRATLVGFRKTCDLLCGSAAEACSYQAMLDLDDRADGDLLYVAFPGRVALSDFWFLPPEPLTSEPIWSSEFHRPIWPAEEDSQIRIDGWNRWTRRLSYSWQQDGTEHQVEEPGCRASAAGKFITVQCHRIAILAADGVPLLVSRRGRTDAVARPVAQFTHAGELYSIVELGTEEQAVYGTLVHAGDAWLALFRRAPHRPSC